MSITSLKELRERAPQEFRNLGDEALLREYARRTRQSFEEVADYFGVRPRGLGGEMRRQFAGGAMVDLPRMVGQGLKATGVAPEVGQGLVERAEERAYRYEPDQRPERGLFGQAMTLGARAVPPMIPAIGAGFLPGGQVAAPTVAATLFGTSGYQDTLEKLREAGVPEAEARAAARRTGAIQGPLEGLATYGALRTFRPVAAAVRGRPTTAGVAQAATDTGIIRPFIRGQAVNIPLQAGTEVLQETGTELVERAYGAPYGLEPEDLGEIAKQSALGGAGVAFLLAPLGLGGSVRRARRAADLQDALYGADTPPEIRAAARMEVMALAQQQGVKREDVDEWLQRQLREDIANTQAVAQQEQETAQSFAQVAESEPAFADISYALNDPELADVMSETDRQRLYAIAQDLLDPQVEGRDELLRESNELLAAYYAAQNEMAGETDLTTNGPALLHPLRIEAPVEPMGPEITPGQRIMAGMPAINETLDQIQSGQLAQEGLPVTGELTPGQRAALIRPEPLTPVQQALRGVNLDLESDPVSSAPGVISESAGALPAAAPAAAGLSTTPTATTPTRTRRGTQAPETQQTETQPEEATPATDPTITNVREAIDQDNGAERILKDIEQETDKADSELGRADKLLAAVMGDKKKPTGKPSFPAQVYAAIRNAILNPKAPVVVRKPRQLAADNALTNQYKARVKKIAEAANKLAAAYEAYASQNLVRSGETIKRGQTGDTRVAARMAALQQKAQDVRNALAELGEAVNGNAKDVEAIVRFVKDRAQKEKKGDIKTEKADIKLSRAWAAAKRETFMQDADLLDVSGEPVRPSREAAARGATPQLVDAATEGYATFGRGPAETGLNGILNYIRTSGTPFERTLAQAVKLSLKGKAPVKVKFTKTGKGSYDPKTNTITINETASREVALHEALHAALQWYVYNNPNAPQVVALKQALQRVVNFQGKLSPKAAEVQEVLRKVLKGKGPQAELNAVLELVSYGNTLNDFRRALQEMPSDAAPRTFVKFANDVMEAIYAVVRRMLGVRPSVASDIMDNTFQLLEAARAAEQTSAPTGTRLDVVVRAAREAITDNAAFRRWFGDSKVVGADGEPLVVYHGTASDFDTFSADKLGTSTDAPSAKEGFFFTARKKTAEYYARGTFQTLEEAAKASRRIVADGSDLRFTEEGTTPNVMPVYLSLQNPLVHDFKNKVYRESSYKALLEQAKKEGRDGVILKNTFDSGERDRIDALLQGRIKGEDIYVVFNPTQIKSAIGNRGTFDPESGNILYASVTSREVQSVTGDPATPKGDMAQDVQTDSATELARRVNMPSLNAYQSTPGSSFNLTRVFMESMGFGEKGRATQAIRNAAKRAADVIRKDFPMVERVLLNINSTFGLTPDLKRQRDYFKSRQNTGILEMVKLTESIKNDPKAGKPILDYLDGDTKALDGRADAATLKAIADNVKSHLNDYISALPPGSRERALFKNLKFTEYLLHPESIAQVASKSFGLQSLRTLVKPKRESVDSLDAFRELLPFDEDVAQSDAPLYRTFERLVDADGNPIEVAVGFISKERAEKNPPVGLEIDTTQVWKFDGKKGSKFQFITRARSAVDIRALAAEEKTKELSATLLNTMAALSHNYASRRYFAGITALGRKPNGEATTETVVFDNIDEINAVFAPVVDGKATGRVITEDNVLKAASKEADTKQIRDAAQRTGVWVKLPGGPDSAYGELGGKYVSGPVWSAMMDMHDRSPLFNAQVFQDTMRWFKKAKTIYTPATHANNILTNYALMLLHGISHRTVRDAAFAMKNFELSPGKLTKEQRELMQAFYRSGAVLGQFTQTEAKQVITDAILQNVSPEPGGSMLKRLSELAGFEKEFAKAATKLSNLDTSAVNLYAAEDNVFRLAAFMNVVADIQARDGTKTISEEQLVEAGIAARKMFLDYDIDARWVRAARQSVLPFVSWTYAIMPVMGRLAITRPWAMINMMAAIGLMSKVFDGDDDEWRRIGPEELVRERSLGGFGPYNFMRVPFLGSDENPVYWNMGKSIPMMAVFDPPMGESIFMGQKWIPGGLNPGGPYLNFIAGAMFGIDPFTGKSLSDETAGNFDRLIDRTKSVYNTMAPGPAQVRFFKNVDDYLSGREGPTGREPSALFLARTLGGLSVYQFDKNETYFYNDLEVQRVKREFGAVMAKAKRDEYNKRYPDYEALDAKLDKLRDRLEKRIDEIRGEK